MKLTKVLSYTLLIILLLSVSTAYASNSKTYTIDTLQGKVGVFGKTGPTKTYYFKSDTGERYILVGKLVEEIKKVKQFQLNITGRIEGRSLTPWSYDVAFNKDTHYSDQAVFIGKLFYDKAKLYLVTNDQYVLRVYADSLGHFNNKKMLLRGKYVKTGRYTGDITVVNFIDLSK